MNGERIPGIDRPSVKNGRAILCESCTTERPRITRCMLPHLIFVVGAILLKTVVSLFCVAARTCAAMGKTKFSVQKAVGGISKPDESKKRPLEESLAGQSGGPRAKALRASEVIVEEGPRPQAMSNRKLSATAPVEATLLVVVQIIYNEQLKN